MVTKIFQAIKKYWGWALLIGILVFIGSLKIENRRLKNGLDELKKINLEKNQEAVYESIPQMLREKTIDELCVMGENLWVE